MKKLLSMVLVVAMLATMLVFVPAAGATEAAATVEAGVAVGAPGSTVTVPVTITASNLAGFSILCEYDGARLEWAGADFAPVDAAGSKAGFPVYKNGDIVYSQWYDFGSFASFSWASAVAGGEDIASEGLLVVNMKFLVKEDAPVGDAYVNIPTYGAVNDKGETIYGTMVIISDGEVADSNTIACTDGKVTVVPEGAFDVTPSDLADFTINANTGALTKYKGSASVVVIPNSVKTISKGAFNGTNTVTTVVIPASVTSIAKGAFINCRSMTDVYILGADTVLNANCMGFAGTVPTKGSVTIDGCIYTDPEVCDETLLNIHSVANDSVDAYVAEGDGYIDEDSGEPLITEFGYSEIADGFCVTAGGITFYAPVDTKIPGSMIIDGKTVLYWTADGAKYFPGADITLDADLVLDAVAVAAPVTSSSVALKANADVQKVGMRFSATMAIADYNALAALGNVELGMLITPAAYVQKAGAFTKTALDALNAKNGAYVDVKLSGYFDKSATDYTFAAHLTNFSASTYANNPNFVAVLYADVTIDGNVVTVYSQYNWAGMRSVKGLANAILDAGTVTDTVAGQLEVLVGKFSK